MPLTKDEIRSLLSDIENERVERTLATDNTKKMSEAICAFANDIRDSKKPGYFLIGADDNYVFRTISIHLFRGYQFIQSRFDDAKLVLFTRYRKTAEN